MNRSQSQAKFCQPDIDDCDAREFDNVLQKPAEIGLSKVRINLLSQHRSTSQPGVIPLVRRAQLARRATILQQQCAQYGRRYVIPIGRVDFYASWKFARKQPKGRRPLDQRRLAGGQDTNKFNLELWFP